MLYKISHTTTFSYGEPVAVCHNQVMLTPRDDRRVQCHAYRLHIRPTPTHQTRHRDVFGNQIVSFAVQAAHRQLSVVASSRVRILEPEFPDRSIEISWESVVAGLSTRQDPAWFDAWPFQFDSPRVARDRRLRDYAGASFTPGRNALDALLDLTARIQDEFTYDPVATSVDTSALEAFALRRGVCQDLAHVQLAALRSLGIPAKYVSGYLRTTARPGKDRLIGADQSHAWVAAYLGTAGWVEVDPTNNLQVTTDHIPLAYGRDYGDVVPIRGVFVGGGQHSLKVAVEVTPVPLGDEEGSG